MSAVAERRLRLNSCIETLAAIHAALNQGALDPELARKFKQLERSLRSIEPGLVSESDVCRVEEAANRLFRELRFVLQGEPEPSPDPAPFH